MSPRRRCAAVLLLLACVATRSSTSLALPGVGAFRPDLQLVDAWGRTFDLARLGLQPVIVVYEGKDSADQNQTFKADLAALAKGDRYKSVVSVVAVADLTAYDFWPVRGFVADAIKGESLKVGTPIYCDWDGSALRAFGLRRSVSNVILYGKDGKAIFSHEGALSDDDRQRAIALLRREVEP